MSAPALSQLISGFGTVHHGNGVKTTYPMVGENLFMDRSFLATPGLNKVAAGTKTASRRRINKMGNLAGDIRELPLWIG
jgi:hypothetical protein